MCCFLVALQTLCVCVCYIFTPQSSSYSSLFRFCKPVRDFPFDVGESGGASLTHGVPLPCGGGVWGGGLWGGGGQGLDASPLGGHNMELNKGQKHDGFRFHVNLKGIIPAFQHWKCTGGFWKPPFDRKPLLGRFQELMGHLVLVGGSIWIGDLFGSKWQGIVNFL